MKSLAIAFLLGSTALASAQTVPVIPQTGRTSSGALVATDADVAGVFGAYRDATAGIAAEQAAQAAADAANNPKATGSTTARPLANWLGDTANVKAFGAKGDGSTDDSAAINAAIASLSTTGGTVVFPPARYAVASTINLLSGVRLAGGGTGQLGTPETSINWTGASGGTVVSAIPAASFTFIAGTGISGLAIHGHGVASYGLYIIAAVNSEFKDFLIAGANVAQLYINETNAAGGAGSTAFNRFCKFYIDATQNEATSLTAMGIQIDVGTAQEDAFSNTFQDGLIYHTNGVGFSVGNADSNLFLNINITQTTGGTGLSLALLGSNAAATQTARDNWFSMLQATGGITAFGTANYTHPATNNGMIPVDTTNGMPTITVGTGSTLTYATTSGSFAIGGAFGVGAATGFCQWFTGNGAPNGVVTANIGSFYTNVGGGAGTTLFVKESGNGTNTGWVGK